MPEGMLNTSGAGAVAKRSRAGITTEAMRRLRQMKPPSFTMYSNNPSAQAAGVLSWRGGMETVTRNLFYSSLLWYGVLLATFLQPKNKPREVETMHF